LRHSLALNRRPSGGLKSEKNYNRLGFPPAGGFLFGGAMERMSYYLLSEAITDCHKKYRALLPEDLRPMLDDLVDLHNTMAVCISLARGEDKLLRIYEQSVMRLVYYFLDEVNGKK
jgi:hypothetical protein